MPFDVETTIGYFITLVYQAAASTVACGFLGIINTIFFAVNRYVEALLSDLCLLFEPHSFEVCPGTVQTVVKQRLKEIVDVQNEMMRFVLGVFFKRK